MRAMVVIGVVVGVLFLMACGRKPLDPAEVETIGLEMRQDHNLQISMPLPDWLVGELAVRPRPKTVATDTNTAGPDSAICVTINNLSKRSSRIVYLAVDLAKATASASINIEVGATVFQGLYRDPYGILLYHSNRVVAVIEKAKLYQVTLKMNRAPVAEASVNVTWDTTSAVTGEPVVIPPPPPPPPPTLKLNQLFASAYYVIDGRGRLEFLIVFSADAGGSGTGVDLQGFDVEIVGSLARIPVDTLFVVEKQNGVTDVLLSKILGSAVSNNAGRLQVNVTIPNKERRIFLIGGVIAKTIGLNELINQTLGLSITRAIVKDPAKVISGMPLGRALPLGFVSENQPILLPRL